MAEQYVTGDKAYVLIRGRIMDATYVKRGDYLTHERGLPPKRGSRRAKTYEALKNGPKTGHALFASGNWMPDRSEPMPEAVYKEQLKWMVRNAYLHVVNPRR